MSTGTEIQSLDRIESLINLGKGLKEMKGFQLVGSEKYTNKNNQGNELVNLEIEI